MAKKDKKGSGLLRKIHIDIEVHRHLEARRLNFDETENAILRRLLALDGAAAPREGSRAKGGAASEGGWSKIGRNGREVFLPDGTELRAAYAGRRIEGRIEAGAFRVDGASHPSPSAAVIAAVAASADGKRINLNGWRLWEVRRPGETLWARLGDL